MKATTALYPIRDAAYYQNQHDECLAYRENNWLLERFDLIKQLPGSSIAEYGCGNCRFLETAASHFAQVYGFDWAEAPHLQDVLRQHSNVHFEKRDIVRNSPAIRTHIAASADFLEHLIPSDVGCVIRHMHRSATINFHVIACYDDTHSHQTIMPPEEWLRLFQRCSQDYYLLCIWQRNDDPSKLVCIVTNHVFPKGQQALNLPGQCHPHYGRKNGDVADRNLLPQTAATPAQYVETRVQQAEAAPEDANKSLNAIRTNRSWRMTALLRWLGRQARLLQDQGLFARMKKLVKKTAKFVLLPWVRCVDAHPKLRRFCASFARIIGVHAPLKAIYLRLSLRHNYNSLATLNLEQTHADGEGLAVPLSSPETITIDEILSRIRAELAAAKGKQE
jgi:hypothetical protein